MEQQNEGMTQDISQPEIPNNSESVNTPTEKMISQSEVNRLISANKREAYERGKREASVTPPSNGVRQQESASLGGMPQLSESQVEQMIAGKLQELALRERAQRISNDFVGRLESGKSKYESSDFDKTIADISLQNFPDIIEQSSGIDNIADVIYHLGKNPAKLGSIVSLGNRNPNLVNAALRQIADSLKQNESAKDTPHINEPLGRIKASTVGIDNGRNIHEYTVQDFRNSPYLRG